MRNVFSLTYKCSTLSFKVFKSIYLKRLYIWQPVHDDQIYETKNDRLHPSRIILYSAIANII